MGNNFAITNAFSGRSYQPNFHIYNHFMDNAFGLTKNLTKVLSVSRSNRSNFQN
jgi:hypothetical protein